MRSTIRSTVWSAVIGMALAVVPGVHAANDPKPAHAKKPADSFLTGDPFTLDQVLILLKQDAIPLRRRKEAIETRAFRSRFLQTPWPSWNRRALPTTFWTSSKARRNRRRRPLLPLPNRLPKVC